MSAGEKITRYPLAWPVGWKRTGAPVRAKFATKGERTGVRAAFQWEARRAHPSLTGGDRERWDRVVEAYKQGKEARGCYE